MLNVTFMNILDKRDAADSLEPPVQHFLISTMFIKYSIILVLL